MSIPDFSHYLVGYRAWFVEDDGYLRSLHNPYRWVPRRPNQSSFQPDLTVREPYGSAGFYAFTDSDALRHECLFQMTLTSSPNKMQAHGRVALWGRMVKHQLGYRAEYAYPLELYVDPGHAEQAERVRQLYGVPVTEQVRPRRFHGDGTPKPYGLLAWWGEHTFDIVFGLIIGQAILQLLLVVLRLNWVRTTPPTLPDFLTTIVIP